MSVAASPPVRTSFHYGWVVVAVAFVTMGIAVNARTAFSLLYPPILAEFGWDRGVTAAAFSIGFLSSTVIAPFVGMAIDRTGPRAIMTLSALLVAGGLWGATMISTPLGLYLTIGTFAIGAVIPMTYIGHSMFLPNWFTSKRGLAIGIAFSGVGVMSIFLFPALQALIEQHGWRSACLVLAAACIVILIPLNLFLQRGSPAEVGLKSYGEHQGEGVAAPGRRAPVIVDEAWAARDWTLSAALRTTRFWWLAGGYFFGLFIWYSVQVHQTRFLIDSGFGASEAAFALGLVGLTGVVGQIGIGAISDRVGREWAFSLAMTGFAICYAALIAMGRLPSPALMYLMVAAQGLLGYGLASLYGPIPAEIFAGRRVATIIGALSVIANIGAGTGPWLTGYVFDRTGSYEPAFIAIFIMCFACVGCIWMAAPRKVRRIAVSA
ncbi:MAG: MFS transporter [Rhizobiaceae bacterium]